MTVRPAGLAIQPMWYWILFPLAGYLAGSIASAIIVCALFRLPDPRAGGSGNPGATNVLRLGGKKAAALTLAGDVLKGVLPVLAAKSLDAGAPVVMATAFAAVFGHVFPVFFKFQGGKGVATAFGAVGALSWPVALGMGIAWLAVALVTRYSSLSSMVAALAAPLVATWLAPHPAYIVGLSALAALLVWRHRENIARLLGGTESRIGQKAKAAG